MATDPDPKVRFILRPTVVGEAIMDRLSAPGVDRAAESRRWIELGFAAEQAGFRMDGSQLRHADRAWHVQPELAERAAVRPEASHAPTTKPVAATRSEPQLAPAPSPSLSPVVANAENDQQLNAGTPVSESLSDRLRKLSA